MMSELRILQCPVGQAGQPNILARALNELGHNAKVVNVTRHKFDYKTDYLLDNATGGAEALEFLSYAIQHYDVFHFHARPFLWNHVKTMPFPNAWDIAMLKAAGKKVIFHFRGQEARTSIEFKNSNPFHYVDDDEHKLFTKFPDAQKKIYVDFITALADVSLAVDPEIQSYIPNSKIAPRAIDMEKWNMVGVHSEDDPLIIHAPSRRAVKGTHIVEEAVQRLKSEGYQFRFQLVEGLTNSELRETMEKADIVVDQLRIGWYGVLSVEAMALGKPVIAYVRPDLISYFNSKCTQIPLVNANPDNFYDKLKELIVDYNLRRNLAEKARNYCEQIHDSKRVAQELVQYYKVENKVLDQHDWNRISNYIIYQTHLIKKQSKIPKKIVLDEALWRVVLRNWQEGGIKQVIKKSYSYLGKRTKF